MPTPNLNEIWQVEVGGEIYEAPFGELGNWIGEGSLQPDDKVRKGNLRWIEARLVPSLIPFFNAKVNGVQMPVFVNTTDASEPVATSDPVVTPEALSTVNSVAVPSSDPVEHSIAVPSEGERIGHDPDFCALHNGIPTVFVC